MLVAIHVHTKDKTKNHFQTNGEKLNTGKGKKVLKHASYNLFYLLMIVPMDRKAGK